jgi:hypothetical protein
LKVVKNLKHERQIEERCAVFMQAMENRTFTLETEIKTKVSPDQVTLYVLLEFCHWFLKYHI